MCTVYIFIYTLYADQQMNNPFFHPNLRFEFFSVQAKVEQLTKQEEEDKADDPVTRFFGG